MTLVELQEYGVTSSSLLLAPVEPICPANDSEAEYLHSYPAASLQLESLIKHCLIDFPLRDVTGITLWVNLTLDKPINEC